MGTDSLRSQKMNFNKYALALALLATAAMASDIVENNNTDGTTKLDSTAHGGDGNSGKKDEVPVPDNTNQNLDQQSNKNADQSSANNANSNGTNGDNVQRSGNDEQKDANNNDSNGDKASATGDKTTKDTGNQPPVTAPNTKDAGKNPSATGPNTNEAGNGTDGSDIDKDKTSTDTDSTTKDPAPAAAASKDEEVSHFKQYWALYTGAGIFVALAGGAFIMTRKRETDL